MIYLHTPRVVEDPPLGASGRWTSGVEVTVAVFWVIFCVILLQKITLPITSLTLTLLLSNFVPSQISRCSCVSGKSFLQNLQVRLSGVFLPFWFILTIAIHLDLYLKYILQLDRDNLWRYWVSSGLRSTLSFDLLPSCILFTHSSLIFYFNCITKQF